MTVRFAGLLLDIQTAVQQLRLSLGELGIFQTRNPSMYVFLELKLMEVRWSQELTKYINSWIIPVFNDFLENIHDIAELALSAHKGSFSVLIT